MLVRFKEILDQIQKIDRDIEDLRRLRARVPENRTFTDGLLISFDKQINELLNRKISLEELEIEKPSAELVQELFSVDVATSTRIRADRITIPGVAPTAEEEKVVAFLREMPKTEIHLHMEACISRETLCGMLDKNNVPYEPAEIEKLYKFSNLQEFIKLFLFIIDSVKTADDFELIFKNLREYLESNSVYYAEVFLAPSRMVQNGLDFNEIASILDHLSTQCRRDGGPEVKYLFDVSRTFGVENASKNLQRILNARASNIIGIGLGGAELMGPAREFKDVFAQAHAEGLRAVAHAGEDDGPWSVRDAVEILGAERIGHGTSAIQDPSLIELLRTREVPIEICLTSNLFTGKYVREPQDHPVRRYYDEGLICTINTDDPEIFNVTLTDEYFKFYRHLGFSISELIDLNRQGVYSTFHPDPASLWKKAGAQITKLRDKYKL
ncbi:MAG: adenosine deaminase [Leptospiraceae bacterium]|nr:adenosine deaminase [Leptospiraceae bacterium]MCB1316315.1 adenosine deaminase [Leptospiraceae bacterium]